MAARNNQHGDDGTGQPTVSIVTIFLDPGIAYLEQAIASVDGQTYPHIEHILVDDGCLDGGELVAVAAARRSPQRVRYLCHEGRANLGMSASRNLGLAAARGPFVGFLDADDVLESDAIERQVRYLLNHPEAAAVVGGSLHWRSWESGDPRDDEHATVGLRGIVQPPRLSARLLHQRSQPPSMNAVLMRASAVADVGGFESSFRSLFEDQAFLFKFFLQHDVVVHDEIVDRYRQHPDSAVNRAIAQNAYRRRGVNQPRQVFRRFALSHLAQGPWRGSPLHREAIWLYRWDRWPAVERRFYLLRPGLFRRVFNRLRGRRGQGSAW